MIRSLRYVEMLEFQTSISFLQYSNFSMKQSTFIVKLERGHYDDYLIFGSYLFIIKIQAGKNLFFI